MTNEEQFVTAIELIADKLGIAATEIYSIFVAAQIVLGVASILECIAIILLCIMTYFIIMKTVYGTYSCNKAIERRTEGNNYLDSDEKSFIMFAPVVGALTSIIGWLLIVSFIRYGFIQILCPEYCAIIEITKLIIP
jgi:ATP-dependent Zn protease